MSPWAGGRTHGGHGSSCAVRVAIPTHLRRGFLKMAHGWATGKNSPQGPAICAAVNPWLASP